MSGGGADEGGRTWSRHYRRPYTVTGGRTRPAHDDLELETLVQTVTGIDEQLAGLGREQRSIAALCREVVSVAEISARLDLLLGVTRVIVVDMALKAWGRVAVSCAARCGLRDGHEAEQRSMQGRTVLISWGSQSSG